MSSEALEIYSNEKLVFKLKDLVSSERNILAEILDLLREADRRNLYVDMGYPSLYEFCVGHLGYAEAAAYRRIQAMRILREVPILRENVENGTLNITHLSQAQSFFNMERKKNKKLYSPAEKEEVILRLQNKSKLEAERELISISPNISLAPEESVSFVTKEQIRLRMTIDQKLFDKLNLLKSLMSHKNPNMSYAELVTELADRALRKLDRTTHNSSEQRTVSSPEKMEIEEEELKVQMGAPRSRHIPERIKVRIWQRDGGKCQFKDKKSGKLCGSVHFVQIDHIIPFSEGGLSTDPTNLRLLCSKHNQWHWETG